MSQKNQQAFLITQTVICLVFNLIFLVLFIRRAVKIDHLGDNLSVMIPFTTWLKFGVIIICVVLMAVHILLSYQKLDYWVNANPNYSLISLFFMANYTLQLYIIMREVRKSTNNFWPNVVYWGLVFLADLAQIIIFETYFDYKNASIVIQVIICIANIVLIVVSWIFQKHGIKVVQSSFREALNSTTRYRTAQSSLQRTPRSSFSNFFVEFNREFQVTQKKQGLCYTFKFAVYIDQKAFIVTRNQHQFRSLQAELTKLFPLNTLIQLPRFRQSGGNLMQVGQQRQKILENYLLQLLRCQQFYVPCLLQFLQIPANMRSDLLENTKQNFKKHDSLFSQQQDGIKIPFFKVHMHRQKILISNPQVLELQVAKKRSSIIEFHNNLVNQKKLNIQLLTQTSKPQDFVHFFQLIANRKKLWRSLASWMGLGSQIQNKIAAYFDVWTFGFKNVILEVVGNQKSFDKQGRIYTQYLLSIQRKIPRAGKNQSVILKKRYSDFWSLDRQVQKFAARSQLDISSLPEMPPKVSPFGSKTSPNSRQCRFDLYVKNLAKIDGINHCVKLLQFLQVDAPQQPCVYEPSYQREFSFFQRSQKSYFSDLSYEKSHK